MIQPQGASVRNIFNIHEKQEKITKEQISLTFHVPQHIKSLPFHIPEA